MHLQGKTPIHANDTFISPSASVIGDVEIWDTSSIWYSVVVRGDFASVRIGAYTNIMDKCVVRTVESLNNGFPSNCVVGNYCSVGAGSILTSCTIGNEVIIGEGCVISEGSVVSSQAVLEPGTVLPPYSFIPANEQWGGSPAKFQTKLDSHAGENAEQQAKAIAYLAAEHYEEYLPTGNSYKHLEDVVGNVSA